MGTTESSRTATFIVRLWLEPGEGTQRAWRGQVEHVQTGETEYVFEMTQVATFIKRHCWQTAPGPERGGIR